MLPVPGANYISRNRLTSMATASPTWLSLRRPSQTIGILLNSGNGTFAKVTPFVVGSSPNALATADFDGAGTRTMRHNADGTVSLLLGRGDGSFRSLSSLSAGGAPLSLCHHRRLQQRRQG